MVRLDDKDRARFDYLKSLRAELLAVVDEDGPLTRESAKRDWERQIQDLEARRNQPAPAEPVLQAAGSPT